MPEAPQCPQCRSTDCLNLSNDNFQCKTCGHPFVLAKAEGHIYAGELAGNELPRLDKKQARNIILGVLLVGVIFAYGIMSSDDSKKIIAVPKDDLVEEGDNAPKYTEITKSFVAVPGNDEPEIWLIKRRNSSDLKEVDYRISVVDPISNKEIYTRPVISTMTWDQSFEKAFQISQVKRAGSRCWLIIGEKELVGYDIATRQKSVENMTLTTQYHQFAEGVTRVENLYNIAGFKVTSLEGFTYYYLPEDSKVLTEVEYDNMRRNENTNNTTWAFQTQYVFSAGEEQRLYKLVRRQQNLRMRKIYPNEVLQILSDESLWYRKMYNVVQIDEFTPGKLYYHGNVLFYDNDYCIYIATTGKAENSSLLVQCLDRNKNLQWSLPVAAAAEFGPFLKAENVDAFRKNQVVVFQIPYHLAIALDVRSGKMLWKYKLEETP